MTGNPDSFYRRQIIPCWAAEWNLDREAVSEADFEIAYLAAAIRAGQAGTGIFGLRLMWENLGELSATLDGIFPHLASDKARFEKAFGRVLFVHLSRADKVAQAVSLIKAEQTGLWHVAPDGTEIERLAPPREPQYDFMRISHELAALEHDDAAWLSWFEKQRISPLRIRYEDLSASPARVLGRICDALGVPAPDADAVKPGIARLSDQTSIDWIRRYRLDLGAAT